MREPQPLVVFAQQSHGHWPTGCIISTKRLETSNTRSVDIGDEAKEPFGSGKSNRELKLFGSVSYPPEWRKDGSNDQKRIGHGTNWPCNVAGSRSPQSVEVAAPHRQRTSRQ